MFRLCIDTETTKTKTFELKTRTFTKVLKAGSLWAADELKGQFNQNQEHIQEEHHRHKDGVLLFNENNLNSKVSSGFPPTADDPQTLSFLWLNDHRTENRERKKLISDFRWTVPLKPPPSEWEQAALKAETKIPIQLIRLQILWQTLRMLVFQDQMFLFVVWTAANRASPAASNKQNWQKPSESRPSSLQASAGTNTNATVLSETAGFESRPDRNRTSLEDTGMFWELQISSDSPNVETLTFERNKIWPSICPDEKTVRTNARRTDDSRLKFSGTGSVTRRKATNSASEETKPAPNWRACSIESQPHLQGTHPPPPASTSQTSSAVSQRRLSPDLPPAGQSV